MNDAHVYNVRAQLVLIFLFHDQFLMWLLSLLVIRNTVCVHTCACVCTCVCVWDNFDKPESEIEWNSIAIRLGLLTYM